MGGYGRASVGGVIDFLNAKRDFGAVADGVTDDTAAITNAIAFLVAKGGGQLYFPSGTYVITSPLQLTASKITLLGDGANSIIKYTGGATSYIIGDTGTTVTPFYNVDLLDLTLQGNGLVNYGFKLSALHHSRFRLRVQNVASTGVYIGWAVGNEYDLRVSRLDAPGGAFSTTPVVGVDFAGTDATHGTTASEAFVFVEGVSGSGIKLGFTNYLTLKGFSENNNRGLEVYQNTFNLCALNMDFESNTVEDVLLTNCYYSNFLGLNCTNTFNNALGRCVSIIGGQLVDITINANARNCLLSNFVYTGTITDNQFNETMRIGITKFDAGGSTFTPQNKLGGRPADVASANSIRCFGGTVFHITGSTQINAIFTTDAALGTHYPGETPITLIFNAAVTVKHNTAGAGGTVPFLLNGNVDFAAALNSTLTVMYDGNNWYEIGRKA